MWLHRRLRGWMEDLFIFVQTPVVTPLVLRSNKSMTKVNIILWLSGLGAYNKTAKLESKGTRSLRNPLCLTAL